MNYAAILRKQGKPNEAGQVITKGLKLTDAKSPILNNCSGKHLGMISRCLVDGMNIKEYLSFDNQHQIQISKILFYQIYML